VRVLGHISGRGAAGGVDVTRECAGLFHVVNGKVTRLAVYFDVDRPLAELGIAPEDRPEDS
jgi:hypothetical protein